MKVSTLNQFSRLDPEDIKEAPGDAEREHRRKKLIKGFVWWSLKEKEQWNKQNNEERIIVKRQFAYMRLLAVFGVFANAAVYNCFLTGIYNFRTTEVINLRRVPFLAKFAVSTGIAYYMCSRLWDTNVYEAELYQVALKYRDRFEKSKV